MGYGIKHTTSNVNNTFRKGNIATSAATKADPSLTFHSGIPVVAGKHTVVQVHESNDPDFWSLDDSEFIELVREMGSTAINVVEAKMYIKGQDDLFLIDNVAYDNIVKENLLVSLNGSYDSNFTNKQPTTNLITNTSTMYFSGNSDGQWSYQTVAGSGSVSTENPRFSLYSAKLTRAGSGGEVNYYWNVGPALSLTPGETYTFSMLVWCDQPGMARLFSYLAGTNGSSDYHPGDSKWHQLSMQFSPAESTSNAQIRFGLATTNSNYPVLAYFDCAQVEAGSEATGFVEGTRTQNTTWVDVGQSGSNVTLEIDSFENGIFKTNVGGGTQENSFPRPTGLATDQYMTIQTLFKLNTLPTAQYANNSPILGGQIGNNYMIFAYPENSSKSHLGVSYDDSRYHANHESVFETEAGRWVQFTHIGIPYEEGGYQRGKLMYYINGILDRDEFISTDSNGWAVPSPFYLAYDSRWSAYSDMEFAETRIYNKQLTSEEIVQNFYGGNIVTNNLKLAVDAGNLVSYESYTSSSYSTTGSISSTLTNGVGWDSNYKGGWEFDGVDDYITFGTDGDFLEGDFTFELWLNVTDSVGSKENYTFNYGYNSNNSLLLVCNTSGNGTVSIAPYYKGASGAVTGYGLGSFDADTTTHLIIRRESGLNTAFVNGVSTGVSFSESTTTTLASGLNIQLGWAIPRNKAGAYFKGTIYQFRIYNTALSKLEVEQNFAALKGRFPS